jgi:hypothetical protein
MTWLILIIVLDCFHPFQLKVLTMRPVPPRGKQSFRLPKEWLTGNSDFKVLSIRVRSSEVAQSLKQLAMKRAKRT